MLPEDVSSVVGGELGAPGTTVDGVLDPGLESTAVGELDDELLP